ncbi:dihydrodipicolinate synthase family protein [Tropicimonas sp. IMCC6043]|uniref:dihydrodipicolinate synthase family protein n=1 Tax=Tropicimonas sp. IMCC6043 TaxID=2510645 RepID=UPI0013EB3B60|nr:dihydrodipicolinate synthase family protein [Tropicimonas sp. IMCC6043]
MEGFGISAALLTPFTPSGEIDTVRLGRHASDVLSRGADGVTLFGTTGEGASIGAQERGAGLEALLTAGIPPARITLCLCATAVADAVAQIELGLEAGIARFLLPPPFYFGGADDAGLLDWHLELFRSAPAAARVILYNIPQVIGIGISPGLMDRLLEAAPDRIVAIKDSSGDWDNAQQLLERGTLPVLVGDERLLHKAVALGCAGSITGMANLLPERLARLFATGEEDRALSDLVDRIVAGPVMPSLKVLLAMARSDAAWERVRPPLSPLDPASREALLAAGMPEAKV